MVDINHHYPDGRTQRVRTLSPVQTKRGAQAHERELLRALQAGTYGKAKAQPGHTSRTHNQIPQPARAEGGESPTIEGFAEDFIAGHSVVERLRDSTIDSQRGILRNHIAPALGSVRVDAIRTKHFGRLKRAMSAKKPELSGKTINNALTVLSCMVKFWYEREGLTAPRFKAGLIKLDEVEAEFYEPAEYEQLVTAAAEVDPDVHWDDIRHEPEPVLRLKRSRYKNEDQPGTKGRKPRTLPMTPRLVAALRALPRKRRQEPEPARPSK